MARVRQGFARGGQGSPGAARAGQGSGQGSPGAARAGQGRAPETNWPNRTLYLGDCLDLIDGMNTATVDLIYLDPPFGLGKAFHGPEAGGANGAGFSDRWEWEAEAEAAAVYLLLHGLGAAYDVVQLARRVKGDGFGAYLAGLAIRLAKMHRVLKPAGALFLHCDPTANSYLRLILDSLFGPANFRNEIIWRRTGAHNNSGKFGSIHDTILFYSGPGYTWHPITRPYAAGRKPDGRDSRGDYYTDACVSTRPWPGDRNSPSHRPWRGWDPHPLGKHWGLPKAGRLPEWLGLPDDFDARSPIDRLDILADADMLVVGRDGQPRLKRYITDGQGRVPQDLITHIWRVGGDRTGYPTEKPVALIDLLIRCTTDPGAVVFDPYCGSGTTLVAAEATGRRWLGADIHPEAHRVAKERLNATAWLATPDHPSPALLTMGELVPMIEPPIRTDTEGTEP